ncbi:MAG: hypothetical protein E5Y63_11465 [Mesorhizobium sp.]|uniref:hypothetical protein n=1 Tax=Mesorhizobium sp. TaxID=1871066 RepID=UPI00120154CE|nr:hypothetical protein [Mesorhizobium sp.]TIM30556.1 MAG: hypothetical protein E5Y63_11465 [Mesorhizobium sp.]
MLGFKIEQGLDEGLIHAYFGTDIGYDPRLGRLILHVPPGEPIQIASLKYYYPKGSRQVKLGGICQLSQPFREDHGACHHERLRNALFHDLGVLLM